MTARKFRLSRRAVLRGAGVMVAPPALEAMKNDRGLVVRSALPFEPSAKPLLPGF
jgi:hypothetical protein